MPLESFSPLAKDRAFVNSQRRDESFRIFTFDQIEQFFGHLWNSHFSVSFFFFFAMFSGSGPDV